MATASVLVIDDEPEILEIMVDLLQAEGCFTIPVQQSRDAIKTLQAVKFDVVLSDVMMPGLTGLDLLETVKTLCPETEVVLVTGHATRAMASEAWAKGACAFLEKPFLPDQLSGAVTQAVWRHRLRLRNAVSPPPPIAGLAPQTTPVR